MARNVMKLPLIFTGVFLVGLLFGMTVRDGSNFRSVWVRSYLKMHSSLVPGQSAGRLIVIHNDLAALSDLAMTHPSILAVSESQFSNIAYVSVEGGGSICPAPFTRIAFRSFCGKKSDGFFLSLMTGRCRISNQPESWYHL